MADVKNMVNTALNNQDLVPAAVNEELEKKFIKKAKATSIKLIPTSIIVAVIIGIILFLLVYFLHIIAISTFAFLCFIFPIYAVIDAVATSKAFKNHDYGFYYGVIVNKTDSTYFVKGLGDQKIAVLFGKKDYNPGDTVIVARVKDDLNLISEE